LLASIVQRDWSTSSHVVRRKTACPSVLLGGGSRGPNLIQRYITTDNLQLICAN